MTNPSNHTAVDVIAQDVECPDCGYNLRGLRGSIVACPECGTRCDAAKLISTRWTKPWHRAPGFNTLLLPTLVATFGSLAVVFVLAGIPGRTSGMGDQIVVILTALVLVLVLWLWMMWRAWRVFDGLRGIWLALLAHLLMAGYTTSVICGIVLLIIGIFRLSREPAYGTIQIGLGLTLSFGGVWVCRRGERYIAAQCIRRYLDKQVTAEGE